MAGSIYRLQGAESRKGNISLSLDTQNATSGGGHRLQTEISSYISGGGGSRRGAWEIKRETGRQEDSVCHLVLVQSNMEKGCRLRDQIGQDVDNGNLQKKQKKHILLLLLELNATRGTPRNVAHEARRT